ncbi:alpha-L-fucosidase [[Ruminococcus] lactaris]|uniref:alpha-L-fucosidase n=1 Tax=[Ruminococcus] lactaris ATCC 29176 TaxID=471875 RepID=B5CMC5_9FIRM|nr:alpha-L-fucosidase [[Ruminococcus] lactaris]EDY33590.1 F5/8 type C domain protein [[Ruminococcus] lactaris ATCC 29176]UWP65169.1 alpha-L-fucosidase [[Ruminococcus] lactaris ATCC 29176]
MKKKTLSMVMGLILGVTTVFGSIGTTAVTVSAASGEVTDADCADNNTDAPAADKVVPDANQYKYQKDELAAFCHFGPNTFNEVEWGEHYGDRSPADIFTLSNDFNADTLVSTLKNAGFKKIIVTAKHHDGFCIWNSAYTDYCVKNTNYKNGEGDVLAEISAACTKYGLDMGLYLSPWDIHEPSYGYYDANRNPTTKENDVLDYNDYYNNQLTEILSNDKYGNNGHFVEVWMDGAKGSGANAQEYDFTRWFNTIQKYEGKAAKYDADCMLFGAGAYTTVRWIGNEDGVAHENTWSKSNVNVNANTIDSNGSTPYTKGYENGNKWTVPECDGRITSGWFWGTNKCTPKTISQLATMYFDSVGHNATMLLNVPPNNQGTVDQAILDRVTEFGNNIEETFRTNLAKATGTTITASNVRGNDIDFKPGNVVDGDDATYWTTDDGTKSGSLTIKWNTAKKFDVVSIEEAIQKGQHINSYKVEYKTSDSANWQTLKSGVTIGAKRLVRTSPVSATQVKITVGTSDGKVPMLSEVGVYKASEGFQLAGTAPEGMETTSVNDTSKFTFSSTGWNPQTGSSYINGQNTWSNKANAEFTYTFDGTKVYLMGTKDPGHGSADVYIDEQLVETINTHATSRSTGTKIFESADLTDGHHTLRVVAKTSAAIGVEAAYVINNGGVGMIELENSAYTMNEESTLDVKVKRVGGTKGTITAKIQPNPGSAIQDDFNTELAPTVTLNDGESEVTVQKAAETRRNTNTTGDRVFSIELTEKTPENAIIGFNSSARITIKDADAINSEKLQTLVNQSVELKENLYSGGWDTFVAALKAAQETLANESATDATIRNAYTALETAKNALVARTKYTTDDRFQFPWKTGTSATLEAEFATELTNSNDSDSDPSYPMKIAANTDASNGSFVTDMAYKDVLKYAYHADKTGTYHVVMRYRSGSDVNAKNGIRITEADGKITEKTLEVDPTKENNSVVFGTVEFDIEVTEAGDGMISVTAPNTNKGPGIDYFIITPKNVAVESYDITATAGEGGTITAEGLADGKVSVTEGESATFTIAANDGYEVSDVKVDGTSVGKRTSYTFENVTAAHTIEATFAFINYTAANPFEFPTTKGTTKTLEAEHATELINSNDSDSDPSWPLSLGTGDWASNGKFLNCMAYKDYAKYAYVATVPGTYTVTGTYRAGAANKLAFSEENGKITATQVDCPSTSENGSLTVKTFTLTLEVTEAGAGTLILTAPDTNKAPQLDKFDIVLTKTADEADLTELQTAITNAEAILNAADKDKYSAAALVELQELVNAGKQLTTASSQADVDAKKAEITAKIADIQTQFTITATAGNGGKIAPTGATNVYKGTSKAFTITPNDGYHVDSLTVDGTAVDVVTEYTFSDVTANHTIAVTFAKDAVTVAKENLLAAINTANEKLAQTDAYTPASLEALQNAVDEAQTVYNKADATQTEVDNAKANVEAKIAALKEKADKSALRLAVKAAEGEAALTDKYTEESIAALQTAIDAANRVLADDNATQAEVDAQVEAVNAAKAALEEKKAPVVKEELEKAVADATEVVGATDKYTEASLAALQSAIDAANAVLQNSDATQDEIDAAVQAVKEARAALKAKDDDKKDDSNKDDDKKDDNNGSDNNGGNNNGNANNGSNNNGSFNNGSSNNGTANGTSNVAKAAKTGDTSNVAGMAMLCLAAGLVAVMARRRRTN